MLSCFPSSEICSPRYGLPVKGSDGRQGFVAPVAFVIHELPMSARDYVVEAQRDIPASALYTNYPRSVHAVFNAQGAAVLMVDPANTAWGLNAPITPDAAAAPIVALNPLYPDAAVIHLAFEAGGMTEAAVRAMARAICCMAEQFNITVSSATVLAAIQFSPAQDQIAMVPGDLLARAISCDDPYNPPTPQDPDLVRCCAENTAAIAALEARIAALEASDASQNTAITALLNQIIVLQGQIGLIGTVQAEVTAIQQILDAHQECIDCVCPPDAAAPIIHYQCAQLQAVTANNTPRRIDFCKKVSDYSPEKVVTGALWKAVLDDSCNWRVNALVRIALRDYCPGKYVRMDLVTCSGRFTIAQVNTVQGMQNIELTGTATVIPSAPECEVWIEVVTNDGTQPISYVEYADFQAQCV